MIKSKAKKLFLFEQRFISFTVHAAVVSLFMYAAFDIFVPQSSKVSIIGFLQGLLTLIK